MASTIKQKTGVCPTCNNGLIVPLIAGACQSHYWQARAALKGPKIAKPRTPIKPVSDKQAKINAAYKVLNEQYAKDYTKCMAAHLVKETGIACSGRLTTHHGAGRVGSLMLDTRKWRRLCMAHHNWAELHPNEAKEHGLSESRLVKS